MTKFFDGKVFAQKREHHLREDVDRLKNIGVVPKLVSIVVGDEDGALAYQELKKRKAENIGAIVEIVKLPASATAKEVVKTITDANNDESVHGVMIQLPLPATIRTEQAEIINAISPNKDVDGMQDVGSFIAPVAQAVNEAVSASGEYIEADERMVAIVGAKGFVGRKIVDLFRQWHPQWKVVVVDADDDIETFTKSAYMVISAVGKPGIIQAKMIKKNSVLIDVGAPVGDIAQDAYEKASFVSPVPGGVGPVTIHFLLANLVSAASGKRENDY